MKKDDNSNKIMKIYYNIPEKKLNIREIARLVKLSPTTVSTIVKEFKKQQLLDTEKTKLCEYVKASRNEKFTSGKKYYNIQSISESGIIDKIKKEYEEPEAIILFGSYSKGEDISKSDIDIAIITKLKKNIDLSVYEKKLNRKINIYEIDLKKAEKEFINELANGVILYGYLKVI